MECFVRLNKKVLVVMKPFIDIQISSQSFFACLQSEKAWIDFLQTLRSHRGDHPTFWNAWIIAPIPLHSTTYCNKPLHCTLECFKNIIWRILKTILVFFAAFLCNCNLSFQTFVCTTLRCWEITLKIVFFCMKTAKIVSAHSYPSWVSIEA